MIVFGIDPSLTSTGVAFVDTADRLTVGVGRVQSKGGRADSWPVRATRLGRLADRVAAETPAGARLAVIEAPSLAQRNAGAAHDRAGLWWGIYHRLTAAGVPVLPVPPSCRAKYATGKGNAGKDEVLLAVARRYPHAPVGGNDEADALVLAAMGARLLGEPVEDSLPKTHLDALAKLAAPEIGP